MKCGPSVRRCKEAQGVGVLCLHLARQRGALRGRGMAPKAQPMKRYHKSKPQQDKSNHLSLSPSGKQSLSASLNFPTRASVCD